MRAITKLFPVILVICVGNFLGCGASETRREPGSKEQVRNELTYIVNEQQPYTGIIYGETAMHSLGLVRHEYSYKNGKKMAFKTWHENGQLFEEGAYDDKEILVKYKAWDPNGNLLKKF